MAGIDTTSLTGPEGVLIEGQQGSERYRARTAKDLIALDEFLRQKEIGLSDAKRRCAFQRVFNTRTRTVNFFDGQTGCC